MRKRGRFAPDELTWRRHPKLRCLPIPPSSRRKGSARTTVRAGVERCLVGLAPRRGARAGGRERRRQVDADPHPVRRRATRPGHTRDQWRRRCVLLAERRPPTRNRRDLPGADDRSRSQRRRERPARHRTRIGRDPLFAARSGAHGEDSSARSASAQGSIRPVARGRASTAQKQIVEIARALALDARRSSWTSRRRRCRRGEASSAARIIRQLRPRRRHPLHLASARRGARHRRPHHRAARRPPASPRSTLVGFRHRRLISPDGRAPRSEELFPPRNRDVRRCRPLGARIAAASGVFEDIDFDVAPARSRLRRAGRRRPDRDVCGRCSAPSRTEGGTVSKCGRRAVRSALRATRRAAGIAYLPEDRKDDGLVPPCGDRDLALASMIDTARQDWSHGARCGAPPARSPPACSSAAS